MSKPTTVALDARLPLTCTRLGTCCHGKEVWLNPWELAALAAARKSPVAEFRSRFTSHGGIRLRFDGRPGWKGLPACSQYDATVGCSVHAHRPLACRLYPLGRERRGSRIGYLHEGQTFPCLEGCPGVASLPTLTVREYLDGQDVSIGETVADAYLETAQDLAEGAFVVVFDSGLATSGATGILARWRAAVDLEPAARAGSIPAPWLDRLQIPALDATHGPDFVRAHREALQHSAQECFSSLADPNALIGASVLMLSLALQLAQSLGGNAAEFGRVWCATGEANGLR